MVPGNGNDDPAGSNDELAQELERLMRELEDESADEGRDPQSPEEQSQLVESAIDDLSITLQNLFAEIDDLRAEIEQTNHRMRRLIRVNHVEMLRQLLRGEQKARDELREVESRLLTELQSIREAILTDLAFRLRTDEGHNDAGDATSLP